MTIAYAALSIQVLQQETTKQQQKVTNTTIGQM